MKFWDFLKESGQVGNSRTLVCSGTCLKISPTGPSDREENTFCYVYVYRVGEVIEYSGEKLPTSFEVLREDESNEQMSG